MWNAGLDDSQARIKIAGRTINHLRYANDTTLMAESVEELKSLLIRVKEESGKAGLKLNIKKTKIMLYGPITSWQIEGEKMEAVRNFIFLGSKITADGDRSHEIKRCLLLERKAMTNLDSTLKSRDITLLTTVCIVKAIVVTQELDHKEGWAPNCGAGGLLRVPWTTNRWNQSILKEINPDYSLKGLMPKLKLQYPGHLMWRADSLEKTLMLKKIEGRRKKGQQRMAGWHFRLNGHEFEQAPGDGEGQGSLVCYS